MDSISRDAPERASAVQDAAPPSGGLGASPPAGRPGLEAVLGAVVMALLVLLTLINVVVRYLSDQSFAWTEEISVYLLIVLTLLGTAWAVARDSHIRIDFFYERGSALRKRVLRITFAALTLGLFGLLTVLLVRAGWSEYEFGETTMGTGAMRWWYTASLAPMAIWVVLRAAGQLWRSLRGADAASQGAQP